MAGSSLVGRFTIAGREDRPARPERYDISSIEKVGDDLWRFNARLRYGNVDTTLPIVVPMRFAGSSSCEFIMNAPSPASATTRSSGWTSLAAIAPGTEMPIAANPLLITTVFGS